MSRCPSLFSRMQGCIGADGLIRSSQGHFDAAEYRRQLEQ